MFEWWLESAELIQIFLHLLSVAGREFCCRATSVFCDILDSGKHYRDFVSPLCCRATGRRQMGLLPGESFGAGQQLDFVVLFYFLVKSISFEP